MGEIFLIKTECFINISDNLCLVIEILLFSRLLGKVLKKYQKIISIYFHFPLARYIYFLSSKKSEKLFQLLSFRNNRISHLSVSTERKNVIFHEKRGRRIFIDGSEVGTFVSLSVMLRFMHIDHYKQTFIHSFFNSPSCEHVGMANTREGKGRETFYAFNFFDFIFFNYLSYF